LASQFVAARFFVKLPLAETWVLWDHLKRERIQGWTHYHHHGFESFQVVSALDPAWGNIRWIGQALLRKNCLGCSLPVPLLNPRTRTDGEKNPSCHECSCHKKILWENFMGY
jgi:hypothetical protein